MKKNMVLLASIALLVVVGIGLLWNKQASVVEMKHYQISITGQNLDWGIAQAQASSLKAALEMLVLSGDDPENKEYEPDLNALVLAQIAKFIPEVQINQQKPQRYTPQGEKIPLPVIGSTNKIILAPLSGPGIIAEDADVSQRIFTVTVNMTALQNTLDSFLSDPRKVELWQALAATGAPSAQDKLGDIYYDGQDDQGLASDFAEAAKWYTLAADQGYAEAQYALGVLAYHGEGTEKDTKKAYSLLQKSAEQGYLKAQYAYGLLEAQQEYIEASQSLYGGRMHFTWLKKASEKGAIFATEALGAAYLEGFGGYVFPPNTDEALKWYKKAVKQGSNTAKLILGIQYSKSTDKADQAEGARWFLDFMADQKVKAEQGDLLAKLTIGNMYDLGEGVPVDHNEAQKWYKEALKEYTLAVKQGDPAIFSDISTAFWTIGYHEQESDKKVASGLKKDLLELCLMGAEQGNAKAQILFGQYSMEWQEGDGKNDVAIKWLTAAAEQGDVDAQYELGRHYRHGIDVDRSYDTAVKWFTLAAKQGHVEGQFNLGQLHSSRHMRKYEEAAQCFLAAAKQGHLESQRKLSEIYYFGIGVEIDYEESEKWHNATIEQGYPESEKFRLVAWFFPKTPTTDLEM